MVIEQLCSLKIVLYYFMTVLLNLKMTWLLYCVVRIKPLGLSAINTHNTTELVCTSYSNKDNNSSTVIYSNSDYNSAYYN